MEEINWKEKFFNEMEQVRLLNLEQVKWKRKCEVLKRQIKMMEGYAGLKVIMMGTVEDTKILEEYPSFMSSLARED